MVIILKHYLIIDDFLMKNILKILTVIVCQCILLFLFTNIYSYIFTIKKYDIAFGISMYYYLFLIFPTIAIIWNIITITKLFLYLKILIYLFLFSSIILYWFSAILIYPYRVLFIILLTLILFVMSIFVAQKLNLQIKIPV